MNDAPLVRVENLRVGFGAPGGPAVVDGVSFELHAGRTVALVGESGSGKSVTARSLVGLVGAGSWVAAGALDVGGASVLGPADRGGRTRGPSAAAWRRIRGRQIGLVLQDALVSLDPLRPIEREIGDALRLNTPLSAAARRTRVLELLEAVGMPEPAERMRQRSGELSGGLRQRALIASAIAADPPVLIADEPTTALDSTVQARILELLESITARGTALLFISHDLAVVSRLADEVLVMRGGRVVESGPTEAVLGDPQHEYTRALVRAVPTGVARGIRLSAPRPAAAMPPPASASNQDSRETAPESAHDDPSRQRVVLDVRGVSKRFARRMAVDDVSLQVPRGGTLGVVGQSGSGKTTLARIILGLTPPDAGSVLLEGGAWVPAPERVRRPRRPRLGAVYQDALSSFDPRLTVGQILADAAGDRSRVTELLDDVGLAGQVADARPLDLSGGQRQRVSIARALAPRPGLIICDEPVSALDVTIQAQVLDLFDELQERHGLSYLFISHDLGVIQHMSDTIAVMHDGRVVEQGSAAEVFSNPQSPYTQSLLAAAPRLGRSA
ncbi:MAG: ABC transporter ATP-binding protein [Herbiconiux sp.]|uniref:dipeptide ABC transporter ATP-binding protein n=1 Tax=Herbiconiux sp. TaxID=1871186 RepID=UPI00121D2EC9|nr:ABC transporter ATP-binding protein [Herbiconiux sp.]TAJ46733.1 MAG: ABC transporter ATP-binding protein [Herbiconiux sp.]